MRKNKNDCHEIEMLTQRIYDERHIVDCCVCVCVCVTAIWFHIVD